METREEALKYCLSFPDTYQKAPFHDPNWQLVRYKENKKAFLWTYEKNGYINLNVKDDPEKAFFWRRIHKSVIPGYHQNKDHWNTIILDGSIPDEDIRLMIAESYDLISVVLVFCPVFSQIFYVLYLIAGLSDMVDGIIARKP